MNKNSRIYIAGHNGMVGSALWRNLEQKGYENLIGRSSNQLNLKNQLDVSNFFNQEKPEFVFLAAAKVGGILANSTFKGEFIYDNLQIQNNIIHSAYLNKVTKLIFLGSSCIYPKLAPQPIKEEYLLTGLLEKTNEPYAIAKISGIKTCEAYRDQYNCNFISVMPTNLYGPNDNFDLHNSHVLPAIIRKIYLAKCLENNHLDLIIDNLFIDIMEGDKNKCTEFEVIQKLKFFGIEKNSSNNKVEVHLWGTGSPQREFLHADDMADACIHLMLNYNEKNFINIGCGNDISISKLSELVKKIIGFNGHIRFDSSKPDGTPRKLLDISRLLQTGWKPKISLEEGIKAVYQTVF